MVGPSGGECSESGRAPDGPRQARPVVALACRRDGARAATEGAPKGKGPSPPARQPGDRLRDDRGGPGGLGWQGTGWHAACRGGGSRGEVPQEGTRVIHRSKTVKRHFNGLRPAPPGPRQWWAPSCTALARVVTTGMCRAHVTSPRASLRCEQAQGPRPPTPLVLKLGGSGPCVTPLLWKDPPRQVSRFTWLPSSC